MTDASGTVPIAQKVARLLRWRTIWKHDATERDQFEGFLRDVDDLYPSLLAATHQERADELGLVIRWKGQDSAAEPTLLLAHYDVVPVENQPWTVDPFAGRIDAGRVWGRGALDDKGRLACILEAADGLAADGFVPRADVYIALGNDEEVIGDTARRLSDSFKDRNIDFSLVLDEGPGIVTGFFPGVAGDVALIGVSEKGGSVVRLRAHDAGGHASTPDAGGPVERLAGAITRLLGHPSPFRVTAPIRHLAAALATRSTIRHSYRYRALRLWPRRGAVLFAGGDRERLALVRTTEAVTRLRASEAANVLPVVAEAIIDQRVLPGDSIGDAVASVARRAAGQGIETVSLGGIEASPISRLDGEAFERIRRAVLAVHPDALVAPTIMVAATDARHYARYSDRVYRFSPFRWSAADRATLHAADESVSITSLAEATAFYRDILLSA